MQSLDCMRPCSMLNAQPAGLQVTGLSLETAMELYKLQHSELFWEKALDTKLLLAWSQDTIMLAFRGTASMANALADLQACGTFCVRS